MLHIHCGPVNSGKTERILTLLAANERAGRKSVLVVPDPATYQYEKWLVEKLGRGFTHVLVLSFNRFCEMILAEKGLPGARRRLSEQGRTMLMWLAAENVRPRLTVLQAASRQRGFAENMARQVANLYSNRVWSGMLTRCQDSLPDGLLKAKMADLTTLFNEYNNLLGNGYTDHYDQMLRACHASENCPWLQQFEVFVDGFDMLNKNMQRLLWQLVERICTVHVSVSMEVRNSLYRVQNTLFNQLADLANDTRVRMRLDVMKKPRRLPEFDHIEQQFSRYPGNPYTSPTQRLCFAAARSPEEEVERAAKEILDYVRQGHRYSEITLLCANLPAYRSLLQRVFTAAGIPLFVSAADPLLSQPLVRTVLYALRLCALHWQQEDLSAYLQSGLAPADPADAEHLLFLAESLGVRPYELKGNLKRTQAAAEYNALAARVLAPVLRLERQLKQGACQADYARAITDFVTENKLTDALSTFLERQQAENLLHEAQAGAQSWRLLCELLEEQRMVLGDIPLSAELFCKLLEQGLRAGTVGVIPSTADCVLAGKLSDGRFVRCQYLLLLGANDGSLPEPLGHSGYITDAEISSLKKMDFDLSPDDRDLRQKALFDVYAALLKPADKLYISWPIASAEGEALRPSLVISRLRELFPALRPQVLEEGALLLSPRQAALPMALGLSAPSTLTAGLFSFLREQNSPQAELAAKALQTPPEQALGGELSKKLYRLNGVISASRLERFAECPFAHFVQYGLRPRPQAPFTANATDVGVVFHNVLFAYGAFARRRGGYAAITQEQCYQETEKLFYAAGEACHNGVFSATALQRLVNGRLKSVIQASAWAMTEIFRQGLFVPLGEEISFGPGKTYPPLPLACDPPLALRGFVDRADLQPGTPPLLRVVDYKTSKKELTPDTVREGLTLQLPLYLDALAKGEKAIPAGAVYLLLDELAPGGQAKLAGIYLQGLGARPMAQEELTGLLELAGEAAARLATSLQAGECRVSPLSNSHSPCDYCDFPVLCQKDPDLHRGKGRKLVKEKADALHANTEAGD